MDSEGETTIAFELEAYRNELPLTETGSHARVIVLFEGIGETNAYQQSGKFIVMIYARGSRLSLCFLFPAHGVYSCQRYDILM
jgi:hypothetical protein